jgi:hypothetical protein
MHDFFLYLEYKSCTYRITSIFNDETDIIANISASLIVG